MGHVGQVGEAAKRVFTHVADHEARVYSAPTDRSTGIICDQTISLDGFYTRQDYPELLRRIRFKDPESAKTLVFITNNFSLPAATICALYKSRWQVELFFKWIKQHLRIKQFYGTSENAVKTQIWIAVSVYVLVAIVKKRLDLDASLYTLLQILSVTLFEKMTIHQALAGDENRCNASQITNQLNLFDFKPDTSGVGELSMNEVRFTIALKASARVHNPAPSKARKTSEMAQKYSVVVPSVMWSGSA